MKLIYLKKRIYCPNTMSWKNKFAQCEVDQIRSTPSSYSRVLKGTYYSWICIQLSTLDFFGWYFIYRQLLLDVDWAACDLHQLERWRTGKNRSKHKFAASEDETSFWYSFRSAGKEINDGILSSCCAQTGVRVPSTDRQFQFDLLRTVFAI